MKIFYIIFYLTLSIPLQCFADSIKINQIDIQAPAGFNKETIKVDLHFKEGDRVTESELNSTLKLLYQRGIYRNIVFEPIAIGGDNINLKIIVTPKLTFGNILYQGATQFSPQELQKISRMAPGEEWSQERLTKGIDSIRTSYRELGYYKVQITHEVESNNQPLIVNVQVNINEEKPTIIDKIKINGTTKEYAETLKKALDIEEGDTFKNEVLKDGLKHINFKLYRDHYLESDVQTPSLQFINNMGRVLITINLQLGPKYEFLSEGNKFISQTKLNNITTPIEADFLGPLSVEDIMSGIIREYQLQGFHFVTVSYTIEENQVNNIKSVTFTIVEGPRVSIAEFTIPNIKHYSLEFYKNYIEDHGSSILKSGYLNIPDLEIALDSVVDFLHSKGFLSAELLDYKLHFTEDRTTVTVEVLLTEAEQTLIESINFSGNQRFPGDQLAEITNLKLGAPLTFYDLKQAERSLLHFYQEEGFYYAQIKQSDEFPQVHFKSDAKLADIYFSVDEGNQIYFGEIVIRGQSQTNEKVIRRELTFNTGDIMTPTAIRKSESNISRTGLFQSVVIRPVNPDSNVTVKRMLILVKERNPGLVEFGAGIASDDGPRGYAGFAYRNLMGWNRTVSARVEANRPLSDYRFLERNVDVGLIEPYLFGLPLIYRLNFIYLKEQSFTYDESRLEARTVFEKQFTDWFKVFFYYSFSSRDIIPINTAGPAEKDSLLGMLGPTFTFEFRDDPYNPTKGQYYSLWSDFSDPALGSQGDVGFYRLQETANLYVPIFNYFTLALAMNSGYLHSTTGQDIPVDLRFLLGGRKSIRGFQETSLGAVRQGTNVIESYYLNPRVELRFPLYWGFGGALFYDGGNVFFPQGPKNAFRSSVGPSFRYKTPVGPLSFDIGIVLDPQPGEDAVRVHFAVGTF